MKTLLKLAQERQTVPILERVGIKGGKLHATDIDIEIIQKADGVAAGLPDGCYYPYLDVLQIADADCNIADWPDMRLGDEVARVAYDSEKFLDALTFLEPAMSRDEIRYYLNGICFVGKFMVATDGHRLHRIDTGIAFPAHKKYPMGLILPKNAVLYLIDILSEYKGPVCATVLERGFRFEIGDTVLLSKLVDGTYPDYKNVIPKEGKETDYDANDLLSISDKLAALKEIEKLYRATLPLTLGDGVIKYKGPGTGIELQWPMHAKLETEITFNSDYLLKMITGKMTYGGAMDPVKFEFGDRLTVLMPMRQ